MKVHVTIYGKRSEVHNKIFTNIIPGQWDWFSSLLFSFHFLYFLPFLNEWPLLLESEKVQSLEIFYLLVIGSLTQIHLIMIVIIFIIFYYHPYYMWHIVIEKVKCKRDSWGWMGELSASSVILSLAGSEGGCPEHLGAMLSWSHPVGRNGNLYLISWTSIKDSQRLAKLEQGPHEQTKAFV